MYLIKDKAQVASIDVDAQYSFTPLCPQELPVPEGEMIVAQLNEQAQWAKYRLGSKDAHSPNAIWKSSTIAPPFSPIDGPHVDVRWPLHCVPGTQGFELIKGLPHPAEYDYFVWKGVELDMHPYGACYHDLQEKLSTGVIEFLKANHVTTIIVGGLATDYCVKNTALQLNRAGLITIVNLAACRGISPVTVDQSIAEMRQQGVIIVSSATEFTLSEGR